MADRKQVFNEILKRVNTRDSDIPKVISIVGGAGSGKTTFCCELVKYLGKACTLGTDDYVVGDRKYRHENLEGKDPLQKYNPDFLNENIDMIKKLKEGQTYFVPTYDDKTGLAIDKEEYTKEIKKVDYIVIEGDFDFVKNPDLLVYFDVSDEVRLKNRIARDIEKGREVNIDEIRKSFELRQKLQHIPFTLPTRKKADLIIKVNVQKNSNDDNDKYEYDILEKDFSK